MPEPREALLVQKAFKFYVVENGQRVVRQFVPGEWLPRSDWDREASARSKRSMINTRFVRDPLTVEVNTMTGEPVPVVVGKPSVTVVNPGGHDPKRDRPARKPEPAGTRMNPKVWGDRQRVEVPRSQPVAGTRLNPKIYGSQVPVLEVSVPTPKRRGRPRKKKG